MKRQYKAALHHSSRQPCVTGPSYGTACVTGSIGYGVLLFSTEQDAEKAAELADVAYEAGYEKAKDELASWLRVKRKGIFEE